MSVMDIYAGSENSDTGANTNTSGVSISNRSFAYTVNFLFFGNTLERF